MLAEGKMKQTMREQVLALMLSEESCLLRRCRPLRRRSDAAARYSWWGHQTRRPALIERSAGPRSARIRGDSLTASGRPTPTLRGLVTCPGSTVATASRDSLVPRRRSSEGGHPRSATNVSENGVRKCRRAEVQQLGATPSAARHSFSSS